MLELSNQDIRLLNTQSSKTLASWWCDLNRWGWPKELPNPEEPLYNFDSRRHLFICWIMEKITLKECLRYWNLDLMDNREFECWWNRGPK